MKPTVPTLMVSIASPVAYVKVCGRATSESGQDFKALIHELHDRGFTEFVLDLTDCLMMDSTFLGVLARMGVKMLEAGQAGTGKPIQLLNANDRVRDLLDNLGVLHLFHLGYGNRLDPERCEEAPQRGGKASQAELCQTSLEAHQTLMEINPENVPKFKEVTEFLAEDLERLRHREAGEEPESRQ